MIGYVTLGSNDLEKASAYYDALLGTLGATRFIDNERMRIWGTTPGAPMLGVCTPHDEKEATVGNGVMVALQMESREKVDQLYAKALELGGSDEGPPGERGPGFYGGYFRDLDGNKFVAFKMG